jgi:hypothetical protein
MTPSQSADAVKDQMLHRLQRIRGDLSVIPRDRTEAPAAACDRLQEQVTDLHATNKYLSDTQPTLAQAALTGKERLQYMIRRHKPRQDGSIGPRCPSEWEALLADLTHDKSKLQAVAWRASQEDIIMEASKYALQIGELEATVAAMKQDEAERRRQIVAELDQRIKEMDTMLAWPRQFSVRAAELSVATDPVLEQRIKMGNKMGYAAIQHYFQLRKTLDSPEFEVWERLTRGAIRTACLCGNMLRREIEQKHMDVWDQLENQRIFQG